MTKAPKPAANPIVARIDAEIAKRGGSRAQISAAAGLDRGFLQKLEGRGPLASAFTDNLQALARAAQIPFEELLAVAPASTPVIDGGRRLFVDTGVLMHSSRIPILGMVAGSAVGHYAISAAPLGFVRTPPALEQVPGAYAVYVRNDSMAPMHQQGDLRFVHPHLPPRKDDSVVVQTRSGGGDIEAFIKLYEKTTQDWLVCRQINPAAEVKYKRDALVSVHRVLTVNELFNG